MQSLALQQNHRAPRRNEQTVTHSSMPPPPRITVSIVTYRSGPVIAACLDRLFASTQLALDVVVFDNASDDDTTAPAVAAESCNAAARSRSNIAFHAAAPTSEAVTQMSRTSHALSCTHFEEEPPRGDNLGSTRPTAGFRLTSLSRPDRVAS